MIKHTVSEAVNVNEALTSPEKKWIDAMEEEMHSIKANKVWELVKLPEGKKTVSCFLGSLSANLTLTDP